MTQTPVIRTNDVPPSIYPHTINPHIKTKTTTNIHHILHYDSKHTHKHTNTSPPLCCKLLPICLLILHLYIFANFFYYLETHTIPTNKQTKINNSHFINSSTELKSHILVTYNNHIYMHNKLIPLTT